MANLDRPKGFEPFGEVLSAIKMIAGGTVRRGEFVKISSDGKCDPVSAGDAIYGLALNNAADDGDLLVADDPNQKYIGQADETEIDAQTDIGNVADVLATADDTTYLAARMEVDSSSIGQGTSKQLLILHIDERPDNSLGDQVDVVCKINEKQDTDSFVGV